MKKWLITSTVLLVLAAGAWYYLKFRKSDDFEPLIKAKLQQAVKDGSNGLYILETGKIEIDIVSSSVVVLDARLLVDSARLKELDNLYAAPNDIYKISFKALSVNGISAADVLSKNSIDLSVVYINEPVVEIYHHKRAYNYILKDTSSLYQLISKELGHVKIGDLIIQKMDFAYNNIAKKNKVTRFENVSMNFKDIDIDSATQFDTTRFLYAKDANIFLNNYSVKTADSLYIFSVDSIALHASTGNMDLAGVALTPRGKKEDFSKKLTYYKDRFNINIEAVNLKNIDWYNLLSEDGFNASEAMLRNGEIEIFGDRSLPNSGESKVGNYPHQLLTKIEMPLNVSLIGLKNFKLIYKEFNPVSGKTGTVEFDKINASITNIVNQQEDIAVNNFLKIDAAALLMGQGNLHAVFNLDLLKANNGIFSIDVDLGKMDGKLFNKAITPLSLVEIKELNINSLKAYITGNNTSAKASVTFAYEGLDINALKLDDNTGKLKSKGLVSFIANTFVIKKSSPQKGKSLQTQRVGYKRDTEKSFFNLIWKTILEGITATVKGK